MSGQPTKYTNTTILETLTYIETYTDEGDIIPSVAGLAIKLGVARSTVYLWAETHAEFSDILGGLLAMQERILINGGLSNRLNSTIVKLVLGKHDYGDRQEIDHKNNGKSFEPMKLSDFYADPKTDTKPTP